MQELVRPNWMKRLTHGSCSNFGGDETAEPMQDRALNTKIIESESKYMFACDCMILAHIVKVIFHIFLKFCGS